MSDLPKWAQDGEDASAGGDLGDKLVDESTTSKPSSPAPAPASDADSNHEREDSGLVSRALCFFRFLAVLTVLLALVVIGTNCYIIYDRGGELKGEFVQGLGAVAVG